MRNKVRFDSKSCNIKVSLSRLPTTKSPWGGHSDMVYIFNENSDNSAPYSSTFNIVIQYGKFCDSSSCNKEVPQIISLIWQFFNKN